MRDDFAVFIMSYSRSNNMCTLRTILRSGYTGKYYIIVGDDDPEMSEYKKRYEDKVIVFSKKDIANDIDTCDCGGSDKVILYARNYCFKLAKQLGIKYFLQLDDDYRDIEYRYERDGKLKRMKCEEFDELCNIFIEYLSSCNLSSVCMAQNGDFVGGINSGVFKKRVKRKAMNAIFCKTDDPVEYIGRLNEDVNTYVHFGKTGSVFLTVADACVHQKQTQSLSGGMTDVYKSGGTYMKSFYTVMIEPSCTSISTMTSTHPRIHHKINWNYAVPKIISSSYQHNNG